MAALESCPKHNMIAYLEKTDGNTEFHEIMDFLTRSSIYYALTLSPLGNVTPLFDSMLVQPTEDEGEALERPSEYQPIPSPPHLSEDQPESQPDPSLRPSPSIPFLDSNPEGSGGNHGGQSSSDISLSGNEDECFHEDKISRKEIYAEKLDAEGVYYMETEDAHNEKGVSIEDQVNTVKPDEGTDKPKVSTNKIDKGTTELKNGNSDENATPTATPTVFGDDETIAEFLVSMSQNKAKQKGVEIKDAEDSNRPRPTSTRSLLTLKPLPKIDPKDKGKKVLEEEAKSDAESEGVNEAERKFAQLANDEEIARKARIEADSILAAMLQKRERKCSLLRESQLTSLILIVLQRRFSCTTRALQSEKDINAIYQLVMDRYQDEIPEGFDRVLWGDLMIMFNPSDEDEFWNSQQDWNVVSWKLHGSSGICQNSLLAELETEDSVEHKEILSVGFKLTTNGHHKELASPGSKTVPVQKQMVFGKDKSNPLIVDSLLKTIRFSIHLVVYNEELAIPEQTATGKGISNPLMAGSLPKTTKPT
ncbi:hypothetical protein Tco_0677969 [Tanacetum coccineum]|uniref:Uncharacterized protein n=1 Tax=Tanacetum coccineum TaxID=301880 RepID=A0ABQ4XDN7_9ASTR